MEALGAGEIAEFLTEIGPRLHGLFAKESAAVRRESTRQWRLVLSIPRVGSAQVIRPGDANAFAVPQPGMRVGFVSALKPIEPQRWLLPRVGLRPYQGAGA